MVPRKNIHIFLLFVAASLFLRFYSFFPAVMDHDESTYLIIGRDIAMGKDLYADVTDTKPAGIFLIYAFLHFIFGYSIFLTRFVVAWVVAITAWLIYHAAVRLYEARKAACAAGMIYIFYTSVWSQFGLSPNTEQFFNLTTISGFLLLLNRKKQNFALSGLIFGVGFMIKYVVLFDFLFLAAFFLIQECIQNQWKLKKVGIVKYILAGVGFSVPFLGANLYFFLGDHFDAFADITYALPFRYAKNPDHLKYVVLLLDFLSRFLPLSFMFFYGIFSKPSVLKKHQLCMFLCWISGVLVAMYLQGKSFDHYTLQLMVPFSLVAGLFFHPELTWNRFSAFIFGRRYGFFFLVVLVLVVQISGITNVLTDKDRPRKIAAYLKAEMEPGDSVYLSNYSHVVYYLLKKECPTRYVHPTILTNPEHARAFGIDAKVEIEKVMESRPAFVVLREPYPMMNELMDREYSLQKTFFDGSVSVFKRRNNDGG